MTTLFPQIKRVDEDETSKIIKNVLFDNQDESKLDQILDEFMHLTEESITISDEDDDADDDSDSSDDQDVEEAANDKNANDDDDDDEDEDDDDDDDDNDEDDEDGDDSESNSENGNNAADELENPTSWNLDQFIKTIPAPNSNSNQSISKPDPKTEPSSASSASSVSSVSNQTTTTQPSGSNYIVQIDLSKLKRIPTAKVPNSLMTARALKHEADAEKDKTKQSIKYLEAAMYFVLHGHEMENSTKSVDYYLNTIPLFKHTLRMSIPGTECQENMTNLKIHTLILRCLSLIYMRLYKLKEAELNENSRIISSQQNSSPVPQADSSLVGVRPQLLSAYKRQIAIFNNLKYASDFWQKADQFCGQHPAVRIFFSTIESNCGPLTMTSPFPKLMEHVTCGLKLLRTS